MNEPLVFTVTVIVLLCVMCWISYFRMRALSQRLDDVERDLTEVIGLLTTPEDRDAEFKAEPETTNRPDLTGLFDNGAQNKRK